VLGAAEVPAAPVVARHPLAEQALARLRPYFGTTSFA
jgi:hypothetical protein